MESDSDEEFSFTPPTIREAANSTYQSLLPEKSKSKYELAYSQFMKWKLQNKITIISENVMTAYMLHAAIIRTDQTINSLDYLFNVKDNFKYQRKCGHLKMLQAPIVP
jgi:hypothetical protein